MKKLAQGDQLRLFESGAESSRIDSSNQETDPNMIHDTEFGLQTERETMINGANYKGPR